MDAAAAQRRYKSRYKKKDTPRARQIVIAHVSMEKIPAMTSLPSQYYRLFTWISSDSLLSIPLLLPHRATTSLPGLPAAGLFLTLILMLFYFAMNLLYFIRHTIGAFITCLLYRHAFIKHLKQNALLKSFRGAFATACLPPRPLYSSNFWRLA